MNITEIIAKASALNASDIHLICGLRPHYRILGALRPDTDWSVLTKEDCDRLARELTGDRFSLLTENRQLDDSATVAGRRIRMNLFLQQECISMALRLLAETIPPLDSLGLPPAVSALTDCKNGIVLVTGETGSGKSTTLAAMIDAINHTRACHVLTLEDPIEYQYTPDKCIFNQREIGRDVKTFADGLKAALREDPDIILVGEMRDRETVETALTAAETGHLVLGTLHTGSAADAVDRIIGVFSPENQHQIRMQLSMTLQAVLSQQLLPNRTKDGRAAACELMMVNNAVRNLIREGKTPQLNNAIATGMESGSVTMDMSLIRLYQAGKITAQTALWAARDAEYIKKYTYGMGGR